MTASRGAESGTATGLELRCEPRHHRLGWWATCVRSLVVDEMDRRWIRAPSINRTAPRRVATALLTASTSTWSGDATPDGRPPPSK